MKKAYTISPEQYRANEVLIYEIKNKYNYPQEGGWRYLDGTTAEEHTPESVKKKWKKATEENKKFKKPRSRFFTKNDDLYNLWLNRDTDEPVTARELYNIVASIREAIADAESRASSSSSLSDWGNTIM